MKFVFQQMFERETRREKILEARNKELRLKEKTKGILGLGGGGGIIIGGGAGSGDAIAKAANKAQGKPDAPDDGDGDEKEDGQGEPQPKGQFVLFLTDVTVLSRRAPRGSQVNRQYAITRDLVLIGDISGGPNKAGPKPNTMQRL